MAAASVKLAAKLGLAGGAVYWTVQQGLWGTAEEGATAGKKFAAAVMPSTVEYLDKIPSYAKVNEAAIKNWNAGLRATFETLSSAPETVHEYAGKAKTAVTNLGKND
ncbi:MICOS complex subunit MIC13 [Elysia marginata]|uniref:MICOS complex subunit MIC13 n=1 Tax=Elysia marginata TaxID=1093978 RepID=A0AAV4HSE0_9GAST|nr:MICOS complex subunit MIC13 [Elysia marginata]